MPLNLNIVNIAGTMTRPIEMAYTPKGTAVGKLSLAINRVWKDDSGTKHEEVDFIDCEAWGKTAEIIEEWTGKGHCIMVEGRLKVDSWEDKESGKKRSKIKVVIEKFHFVSKPKSEQEQGDDDEPPKSRKPPERRAAAPPQRKPVDPDLDAPEEDDIPF